MNKPVINQAGDREGLRERQKQKEGHQGHAQLTDYSSLKVGRNKSVQIFRTLQSEEDNFGKGT